jgi:hypothetical protein
MEFKIVMFKNGIVPAEMHAFPQPVSDFQFGDDDEIVVNEWHNGLLMQPNGDDPVPFYTEVHEYPNSCGGVEIENREYFAVR